MEHGVLYSPLDIWADRYFIVQQQLVSLPFAIANNLPRNLASPAEFDKTGRKFLSNAARRIRLTYEPEARPCSAILSVKLQPVIPPAQSPRRLLFQTFTLHMIGQDTFNHIVCFPPCLCWRTVFHRPHRALRAHHRLYFASKLFFKQSNLHDSLVYINIRACPCVHATERKPVGNEAVSACTPLCSL